jgi:hypothetical protein
MLFRQPFLLGPFSVDTEGRLSPAHEDAAPGFSVRWRGRVIHARLAWGAGARGVLTIHSDLGRIPSTASDPGTRAACFAALRHLLQAIPAKWNLRVRPDHQQRMEMRTTITLPVTAISLVTEVVVFLLNLAPFLDVMETAGLRGATEGKAA